jgi:hypothetical protein
MTTSKRRDVLFLEERLSVVRHMLNEQTADLKTPEQVREFALRAIAVCDGERYAVPRKYRHIVRRP